MRIRWHSPDGVPEVWAGRRKDRRERDDAPGPEPPRGDRPPPPVEEPPGEEEPPVEPPSRDQRPPVEDPPIRDRTPRHVGVRARPAT